MGLEGLHLPHLIQQFLKIHEFTVLSSENIQGLQET